MLRYLMDFNLVSVQNHENKKWIKNTPISQVWLDNIVK